MSSAPVTIRRLRQSEAEVVVQVVGRRLADRRAHDLDDPEVERDFRDLVEHLAAQRGLVPRVRGGGGHGSRSWHGRPEPLLTDARSGVRQATGANNSRPRDGLPPARRRGRSRAALGAVARAGGGGLRGRRGRRCRLGDGLSPRRPPRRARLDIGLPGRRRSRPVPGACASRGVDAPVLFLTARDTVDRPSLGLQRRRRRLRDQALSLRRGRGTAARAAAPPGGRRLRRLTGSLRLDPVAHSISGSRRRAPASRRPSSGCWRRSRGQPGRRAAPARTRARRVARRRDRARQHARRST